MRRLALSGFVVALLCGAAPGQTTVLPFSGTVSICQGLPSRDAMCPGDPSLELAWQVQGLAQLDGSSLSFVQPAQLQGQSFMGSGEFSGSFKLIQLMAAMGQLGTGTVDLSTQGVQGLGVHLDDLEMQATFAAFTTFFTFSGSRTIRVLRTTIRSLLFDSGTLGTGASIPGQITTLRQFTTNPTVGVVGTGPATLTAPPWSQVAASVGAGGGVLQLVTPLRVSFGGPTTVPEHTVLVVDLVFVPEPATGLLFGLGAVAFGWRGRRRRLAPR